MYFSTDILDGSRRWPQSLQLLGIAIGKLLFPERPEIVGSQTVTVSHNIYGWNFLLSFMSAVIQKIYNNIPNKPNQQSIILVFSPQTSAVIVFSAIVRCYNKISQF